MRMIEKIFVCPPMYYEIVYAINPYMAQHLGGTNPQLCRDQWNNLCHVLRECGAEVVEVPPAKGYPDQVFMSDPGITWGNQFFVSQFASAERGPEANLMAEFMASQGYQVSVLPQGLTWEGNGEVLFALDENCAFTGTCYGGYGIRTKRESLDWLEQAMGCNFVKFRLTKAEFYHLDTCFCPIPGGYYAVYPDGLDATQWAAFSADVEPENLYIASQDEVSNFNLNAVVLGKNYITHACSPEYSKWLQERGFTVRITDVSEFIKAGGSVKCLTQRVYREAKAVRNSLTVPA